MWNFSVLVGLGQRGLAGRAAPEKFAVRGREAEALGQGPLGGRDSRGSFKLVIVGGLPRDLKKGRCEGGPCCDL